MEPTIVLVECSCKSNEEYANGSKPKFFNEKNKAIKEFFKGKNGELGLYWGIHYKGWHLCGRE